MATDPPGTPVAPCINFNLELERERTKEEKEREEVLHLFRCYTHTHTHIYCRFTWQAWHKLTSTVVLRGSRGTDGTWWRAWTGLGACDAAALCVAGVAQPDIHLRFTWQAWDRWHWVARLDGLGRL